MIKLSWNNWIIFFLTKNKLKLSRICQMTLFNCCRIFSTKKIINNQQRKKLKKQNKIILRLKLKSKRLLIQRSKEKEESGTLLGVSTQTCGTMQKACATTVTTSMDATRWLPSAHTLTKWTTPKTCAKIVIFFTTTPTRMEMSDL